MRSSLGVLRRCALLAFVIAGATAASASAHGRAVTGHVYINDNTSPTNTVAAFDRHADGSLTPVPGIPVSHGWRRYRRRDRIAGGAADRRPGSLPTGGRCRQ